MKKPMKFKRYEGGGEISGTVDPKEAADKEAGLKASKDDDIGFLQRLRMGNIDDPSSEAYKRFGAGRGRASAMPAVSSEEDKPRPQAVARPPAYPNPIFEEGRKQGMRQPSGDASVAEDYANRPRNPEAIMEADNPRKTAPKPTAPKPDASKPSPAKPAKPPEPKVTDTGDESSRLLTRYKKPPLRQETMDERAKRFIEKREAAKREKEANPARGRGGVAYQKGGVVSSASKRADGIATKGKTRGKIC
jgi:hypothetical protein